MRSFITITNINIKTIKLELHTLYNKLLTFVQHRPSSMRCLRSMVGYGLTQLWLIARSICGTMKLTLRYQLSVSFSTARMPSTSRPASTCLSVCLSGCSVGSNYVYSPSAIDPSDNVIVRQIYYATKYGVEYHIKYENK